MAAVAAPPTTVDGGLRAAGLPARSWSPTTTRPSRPSSRARPPASRRRSTRLRGRRARRQAHPGRLRVPQPAGRRGGRALRRGARRRDRSRAPEFPVWSNRTAAPVPGRPRAVRADSPPRSAPRSASSSRSRRCTRRARGSSSRPGPGGADPPGRRDPRRPTAPRGRRATDAATRRCAGSCRPRPARRRPVWRSRRGSFRGRDARRRCTAQRRAQPGWMVDGQLSAPRPGHPPGALRPAERVTELIVPRSRQDHVRRRRSRTRWSPSSCAPAGRWSPPSAT